MKRNLFISLAVAIMCFASIAHADFTFHSNAQNSCEFLPGKWSGKGSASNWFIGNCSYHGSGTISPLDETGRFTVEVLADKDSGSFVCPGHTTYQLIGVCVNGQVAIQTEYGKLHGVFTQDSGSSTGTLTVSPGIDVDVKIEFHRTN